MSENLYDYYQVPRFTRGRAVIPVRSEVEFCASCDAWPAPIQRSGRRYCGDCSDLLDQPPAHDDDPQDQSDDHEHGLDVHAKQSSPDG